MEAQLSARIHELLWYVMLADKSTNDGKATIMLVLCDIFSRTICMRVCYVHFCSTQQYRSITIQVLNYIRKSELVILCQ